VRFSVGDEFSSLCYQKFLKTSPVLEGHELVTTSFLERNVGVIE